MRMTGGWYPDVIDVHSGAPAYAQIEDQVRLAIAAGRLKTDDRLPCVRDLADRLGVNPNTVAKAYRDLQVMGLIYSRRGVGVFIERRVAQKCREECRRRMVERVHAIVDEAKAAGMPVQEIREIVEACLASDTGSHDPTPGPEGPRELTAEG